MKKRRLFLIVSISLILVFAFLLASPFFKLQSVEIKFLNENNEVVLLQDNNIFNNQKKVDDVISSGKFDFGDSLFLINKNQYSSRLDKYNPYFKLISISAVFPNKMLVCAKERKPIFYISNQNQYFLLDEEFKILEITSLNEKTANLIELSALEDNDKKTFFEFFNVSPLAFEAGQYLWENNLVIENIKNSINVFNQFDYFKQNLQNIFSSILIYEKTVGTVNIKILTKKPLYGIVLQIENVLENFDNKLYKLLCAFKTLIEQEKIKTTYGVLSINNSLNCFWNNL